MRKEILQRRLAMYLEAEQKILNGQEYRVDSRTLRRADLSAVQRKIDELTDELNLIESAKGNIRSVVF